MRNLRTNFYTYAGVVKALDGVSFDMWEGDTMGLVGETGCGKSVTALSVLRLIAQPPGKIEEGEVLFDVPPDVVLDLERMEAAVRAALPPVFGDARDARPEDLGVNRLRSLRDAARTRSVDPAARDALLAALDPLLRAKQPYDLLGKSEEDMRKIRGNKIAMIFQEPMQALNPVFPIGDQIAENILLHQRDSVVRALVDTMELEVERDAIAGALRAADATGATSSRPLPAMTERPRPLVRAVAAWFAISTASLALLLPAAFVGGLLGPVPGAVTGFVAALAAASIVVAGAAWDLRPWSRSVGVPLAALQGVSNLFLVLFPFTPAVRAFVLVAAAVDGLLLWYLNGSEAKTRVVGRRSGWEAAFVAAEGDLGELGEFRDLLAGSRLDEATREGLLARLDAFIPKAQRLLEEGEPVSGHFHPLFPRRFQLSLYRRLRRPTAASLAPRLREALASLERETPWPFRLEDVRWLDEEPERLRIVFPKGTGADAGLRAVERAFGTSRLVRLRAAATVEPAVPAGVAAAVEEDLRTVVVRIARQREPPTVWLLRHTPVVRRIIERPIYEEAVRRAVGILGRVRISDPSRIARQYPYELSGGMQQRSLIAIAMSCNPRLLIADEPTTALDVTIQAQILDLIRKMKKEFGSSVLIITHDLGIIAEMCNRVCVMYAGTIAEDATVRAVFKAPLHPYTQGLMKAVPSHTVRKLTLEIIRGSVPNLIHPPPGCRFHPRCPMVMPTCGWSPAEVWDHLQDVMREIAAESPFPFDVGAVAWEPMGPTELRIVFPAGVRQDVAVEAVRRARDRGRDRPAIGAITSIEAGGATEVVARLLDPVKPPAFTPEPGHAVACLLYESPSSVPVAGGAPRG